MSVMNKTYKKYSIEEKISFVKLNETMSAHQIENKYNISRQCLRTWKKNLSKMKALTNKIGKFKLAGEGRIPYTYEHETDIKKFIKIARAHNIAVNTWDIIKEAIKYYPEMKNKSYSSQMK